MGEGRPECSAIDAILYERVRGQKARMGVTCHPGANDMS